MLRLRLIHTRPEEPVGASDHTAELIDAEGKVVAVGHIRPDAEAADFADRMPVRTPLTFIGEAP